MLQRYTYRVLQTVQMKLILLCVWAEPAILGSTKNIAPRSSVPKRKKFEINVGTFSILNIVVENKEKNAKIKRQLLFTNAVAKFFKAF